MRNKPLQTIPTIKRKLSLSGGKAIGDPIIQNRNGHEHHHRHEFVDEVGEPDLEPAILREGHDGVTKP